ncbi:MAG: alginate lyase family protein [Alistipes sp.]|nr:alginate lyase family protein [Alistipes sp.]
MKVLESLRLLPVLLLGAVLPVGAQPFMLNAERAERVRRALDEGDARVKSLYDRALRDADKLLALPDPTVVDKGMTPPSGDKHDYISMGRYWWPNPATADGLPYVRRDGESNPELKQFDRDRLGDFTSRLQRLAGAYLLGRRPEHARKAASMLRTWFINPRTMMNPNAVYAQMVPGRNGGLGRPEGVLDTYSFIEAVDAIRVLERDGYLSKKDMKALREWFSEYVDWLRTSDGGLGEYAAKNNHGVAYDVQTVLFALFAGRDDVARELAESFAERRLRPQIEADGRQPLELARTTAFGYSTYNLTHLLDMCVVARTMGIDLYDSADGAIDRAIGYLVQFLGNREAFPYKQIKDWRGVEQNLARQLLRAANLKENAEYRCLYEQYRSPEEQKHALFILFNE